MNETICVKKHLDASWLSMQTFSWRNLPHYPGSPHMGQNALSCLGQLAHHIIWGYTYAKR